MRKNLLWALLVSSACFSQPVPVDDHALISDNDGPISDITRFARTGHHNSRISNQQLNELKAMLHKEAPTLNTAVIDKVTTSLQCATEYNVDHNNILTVIDYSLPSSEKRLWVFDLKKNTLLFNTYVSHGIKSGTLLSNYFSNINNSKASSIGVYRTEKSYYGREGLSLRLDGLDRSFNDNAANRAVVMHGGWYVDEPFIKKYGRAGRSWGCPALPLSLYEPIIKTIRDQSLMVIYYPSDAWFVQSKFLNCTVNPPIQTGAAHPSDTGTPMIQNADDREPILFVDLNKNKQREENEPIVVVSANSYQQRFQRQAPLERMLRRQINQQEYIALSAAELSTLSNASPGSLSDVAFVIPAIVMKHGYYETEMRLVNMGKIQDIKHTVAAPDPKNTTDAAYTVYFDNKPAIKLTSTNRFIRWLGL